MCYLLSFTINENAKSIMPLMKDVIKGEVKREKHVSRKLKASSGVKRQRCKGGNISTMTLI
jgi:hypothetical protein